MRILQIIFLFTIWPSSAIAAFINPNAVDTKAYNAFPKEFQSLASKGLARDKSGLLGRNRKWGRLYSPRFQLGAGKALRITIAAGNLRRAKQAYLGIKKGTEGIKENGYIRTTVPKSVARGRSLSSGDIASAAAFYLGDACLGIKALEANAGVNKVANKNDHKMVKKALKRGVNWLLSQQKVLMNYDRRAPNRLLFDALAFQACGSLLHNQKITMAAPQFVQKAVLLQHASGYFIEGGGWDTSYQAVSINVGKDVLLAGFQSSELEGSLYKAAIWLARRIDNQGRVDSSGNKRTCEGGESFLGNPKKIALDDVFMSLTYLGVMQQDQVLLDAAKRVSDWHKRNSGGDPCFSRN